MFMVTILLVKNTLKFKVFECISGDIRHLQKQLTICPVPIAKMSVHFILVICSFKCHVNM